MSTKRSSHDVRLVDSAFQEVASMLSRGCRVYLAETRPSYRSDAKFHFAKRVALVAGGRAVILSTNWQEGEEDFRDYSTWSAAFVDGWSPDESWTREETLEVGPVSDVALIDEVVDGAVSDGPVVFTRALLLQGNEQVLAIAADVEESSGLDLSVSEVAVQEYLELSDDVRRARPIQGS